MTLSSIQTYISCFSQRGEKASCYLISAPGVGTSTKWLKSFHSLLLNMLKKLSTLKSHPVNLIFYVLEYLVPLSHLWAASFEFSCTCHLWWKMFQTTGRSSTPSPSFTRRCIPSLSCSHRFSQQTIQLMAMRQRVHLIHIYYFLNSV